MFVDKYPRLFEKLTDGPVEMEQLEYILRMFEQVHDRSKTFDGASREVGQVMFDRYVKPNLPEVPDS